MAGLFPFRRSDSRRCLLPGDVRWKRIRCVTDKAGDNRQDAKDSHYEWKSRITFDLNPPLCLSDHVSVADV